MAKADLMRKALQVLRNEQAPAGFHVREQWLADALGVSRSPARQVLKSLAGLGVVRAEPRQGYFLCLPSAGLDRAAADLPDSEIDEIYRKIALERFASLIGEQVSVGELVQRYGTNRNVITKVLARMQEHGLVEKTAGHAWAFRPALNDQAAYEESFRFRRLVEPAAVLEPHFDIPPARLEAQIRLHERHVGDGVFTVSAARLFAADFDFHNLIADSCGNRFFAQAIRQQTLLRQLSELETYASKERLRDSFAEHLRVLRALAEGDAMAASQLLADHIQKSQAGQPDYRKVRVLTHRRLTRR